jgi:lipopolysaccharide export system protein LptC
MAAAFDNLHSRLVFWLKIILPLLALAVLSTLFLFSRQLEVESMLPYAEVDLQDMARDQRMSGAEFTGMTRDGAALRVSARVARPGADGGATAQGLVAAYDTAAGLHVELSAADGVLDRAGGLLSLSGGVEIVTSSGFTMTTGGLVSRLDQTKMATDGAVSGTAPFGTLTAGGMEMDGTGPADTGHVLVFNRGVRLIYDPKN